VTLHSQPSLCILHHHRKQHQTELAYEEKKKHTL